MLPLGEPSLESVVLSLGEVWVSRGPLEIFGDTSGFHSLRLGAWPREDRPENVRDSFMVKADCADLLQWSSLSTAHYKGTEPGPHSLQQVLSGTTEDLGPSKKEANLCQGGSGQV